MIKKITLVFVAVFRKVNSIISEQRAISPCFGGLFPSRRPVHVIKCQSIFNGITDDFIAHLQNAGVRFIPVPESILRGDQNKFCLGTFSAEA